MPNAKQIAKLAKAVVKVVGRAALRYCRRCGIHTIHKEKEESGTTRHSCSTCGTNN